jgi:hypothetical protein
MTLEGNGPNNIVRVDAKTKSVFASRILEREPQRSVPAHPR